MEDTYRTIAAAATAQYKDRGSRFLAYAWPVSDEQQVKDHLTALRRQYFDATHHCYAYILGKGPAQRSRAQDDGEPAHTAGTPILGQLRALGLTDTLVVVVRYFGGTKLGASGLIQAYKTSAEAVLREASVVERFGWQPLSLQFDYAYMEAVMRRLKSHTVQIQSQDFGENCLIRLMVREGEYSSLIAGLPTAVDHIKD